MARRGPFTWLLLARLKEFVREPAALFAEKVLPAFRN